MTARTISRPAEETQADLSEAFKAAFRRHPAGVALVTADDGSGPVALTATSVSSVSVEPAMLVVSLSHLSSSTPTITNSDTVVIHLLGPAQLHLARLCATSGIDRFADTSLWKRLPTGEPYFPATPTWIRGRITDRMVAGTSTVVAVTAVEVGGGPAATGAIVYHDRAWHLVGEGTAVRG